MDPLMLVALRAALGFVLNVKAAILNSTGKIFSDMKLLLKGLGDLRDGILVSIGLIYALGYLIWSFSAWRNNLGMLPLLEPQYLLAGSIPFVILSIAYILIQCINIIPYFVLSLFSVEKVDPEDKNNFINTYRHDNKVIAIKFLVILIVLLSIFVYALKIYPEIPQDLGGINPRVAYLDLKASDLSNDTLQSLFNDKNITTNNGVWRTPLINIYFSGRDFIIVGHKGHPYGTTIYQIPQSTVKGISYPNP